MMLAAAVQQYNVLWGMVPYAQHCMHNRAYKADICTNLLSKLLLLLRPAAADATCCCGRAGATGACAKLSLHS
jgi:hypothetical protein